VREKLIRGRSGIVGFIKSDTTEIMEISFDILSLEALFLVPRFVLSPG